MPLEFREARFFPPILAFKCGEEVGLEESQEFRGVPSSFLFSVFYESLTSGEDAAWGEIAPPRAS